MKLGYSFKGGTENTAKAMGKEFRISPKHSEEICRFIKGKKVDEAKRLLTEVIELKTPVPMKRHNKKVAHRKGKFKWHAGRFPRKAASHILRLIESAEANAIYKGLDRDRLFIKHAATHRGRIIRGFKPRAYGRATPWNTHTSNIEIVLEER
ncbi:MAG: 50S ribosomal protein L22 [Candidatus Hydrothermarchaeota archaeon]